MTGKQTSQNRKSKFYDDILNARLRELLDADGVRTEEVADAVGIGSSAVRSWCTGYARPDIDKIPAICRFFGVSADWLLGISDTKSVDIEMRDICEKTGLSENALFNLMRYNENRNADGYPNSPASAGAEEKMWFINHIIDNTDFINTIANNANLYVNIRDAIDNNELPDYEGAVAIDLMKMGIEQFGMTFNFTQGKETAYFHAFLCQKDFMNFIEGLDSPAYWLKGWEAEVRKKIQL
ncbi:MAG: helix-turn-helix transcriptional regulator [Defluviitaleaceae bacterium]|nr:helix-turn-helix transcriptional regulator [Defluviitaleaceae bacterium]MCL2261986.1 helix-turn-helix transcriptional regulator [Defluviitaleaceae bacterium]